MFAFRRVFFIVLCLPLWMLGCSHFEILKSPNLTDSILVSVPWSEGLDVKNQYKTTYAYQKLFEKVAAQEGFSVLNADTPGLESAQFIIEKFTLNSRFEKPFFNDDQTVLVEDFFVNLDIEIREASTQELIIQKRYYFHDQYQPQQYFESSYELQKESLLVIAQKHIFEQCIKDLKMHARKTSS